MLLLLFKLLLLPESEFVHGDLLRELCHHRRLFTEEHLQVLILDPPLLNLKLRVFTQQVLRYLVSGLECTLASLRAQVLRLGVQRQKLKRLSVQGLVCLQSTIVNVNFSVLGVENDHVALRTGLRLVIVKY